MTLLKVVKRSPSSINVATDWNPSVFRYYIDAIEVKTDAMKNGIIPPFLAMLNELVRPDSENADIDGNWSFSSPVSSNGGIGGTSQTINTYDGVKYIYSPGTSTQLTALIPAVLNGFTGRTFKAQMQMMGYIYIQTTNLNEITHGEYLEDGFPPEIVDIEAVGGIPFTPATFSTTPQGYYAVQGDQVGTHGKDGSAFRPLSFWDELITTPGDTEYTGTLTEGISGFTLDTQKICFNLTNNGNALDRYNPIDLITFAELIKLQYQYRPSATVTGEM